ncbi:hypothetical protein ASPSYDRAFT_34340 [Aspergillus sydowii CBS 593.65]|uniref:Uncharacterized protein n=1 Tax=Aspergillus sydowii CBS 593.65 TaxID=1036612 RepID=A0A1L9T7Q7_9EURO|nr:uncharacterized protein ASPSYDRAFT_34340 [Aspergillus sydowii CBS 593.65]OJJ55411.1 hypothetical protein ASPSYDRAFT_34340 [Aspergillus sydowii CBS 593.65]
MGKDDVMVKVRSLLHPSRKESEAVDSGTIVSLTEKSPKPSQQPREGVDVPYNAKAIPVIPWTDTLPRPDELTLRHVCREFYKENILEYALWDVVGGAKWRLDKIGYCLEY